MRAEPAPTREEEELAAHREAYWQDRANRTRGQAVESEEGPLLENNSAAIFSPEADRENELGCSSWSRPWQLELTEIIHLSAPATIQAASQYCTPVVTMAFVGQLGFRELAAAAVSVTYFNFMAAFMAGMSSALDTLASQAYGAGDLPLVKIWAVTAAAVLTITSMIFSVGLWFAENVAVSLFGQGPDVAPMVGSFSRWLILGIHSHAMSLVLVKMSQVKNEMWLPAMVTKFAFSANIGMSMLLVKLCGVWGGALSLSLTRILTVILLLDWEERLEAYLRKWRQKLPWAPPVDVRTLPLSGDSASSLTHGTLTLGKAAPLSISRPAEPVEGSIQLAEALREGLRPARMLQFLKLGIPGGFSVAIEAGAWEIMVAIAGKLGTLEVDATATLLSIVSVLFFVCPYGFAVVATIRVGNLLGAGRTDQAKLTTRVVLICSVSVSALAGAFVIILRHRIGRLFVDDAAVADLVARIAPYAACNFVMDGLQAAAGGALRGMGRQGQLLMLGIAGFWGGGVLPSALLAFPAHWGIDGLWLGLNCGTVIVGLVYSFILYRVDWRAETNKARTAQDQEREQQFAKVQQLQQLQMGELG